LDSDSFDEDNAPLLQNATIIKPWHRVHLNWVPCVLLICFLSIASFTSGYLLSHFINAQSQVGTYENGFKTDFPLPVHVPLQDVLFTGSPQFFKNGTSWRPKVDRNAPWPENETYFGPPSDEIDAAWDKLLMPIEMTLSEGEAKAQWGDRYTDYWREGQGIHAVLDVFHTLHCLNFVRKAFYLDRYPYTPLHGEVHLEHCLDIIRQTIQCQGSTTMIPAKFFEGVGHIYIDANQVHTCRDIRALRQWADDRAPGRQYHQQ